MIIKSVKAVILKNNKYLLQLRDDKKNIFFPNYWGLFGGRLDKGEKYSHCIKREINEEINLNIKIVKKIMSINYNMIGLTKKRDLKYYECFANDFSNIRLFEGKKFKFFSFNELKGLKIIPMDYVAINAHFNYTYSQGNKSR